MREGRGRHLYIPGTKGVRIPEPPMEFTSSVLDPGGLSIEYIYNEYMRTKISQRVCNVCPVSVSAAVCLLWLSQ